MKLAIASDLHLEHRDLTLNNDENADVLILAGDICSAKHFKIDFFEDISKKFRDIVYVVGNHEHYNYLYNDTVKDITDKLKHLDNIRVLNNQAAKIGDINFIGSTMWTNMNNSDKYTMELIKPSMPDWRIIKYFDGENYIKYSPEQSVKEHNKSIDFIATMLESLLGKKVVITHHSPSRNSVHSRYENDSIMNGGFHSNLDYLMNLFKDVKLWVHGHTHDPFDYTISETRVICNPRAYPKEYQHDLFKLKYIEV